MKSSSEAPGFVFVADQGRNRADVIALFNGIASTTSASCSLFFVDQIAHAFYQLGSLLTAVKAEIVRICGAARVFDRDGVAGRFARSVDEERSNGAI